MTHTYHDVGERIQALTLLEFGWKPSEIAKILPFSVRHIYRLRKLAIERGYNPAESRSILIQYVQDAPKAGRPLKATKEKEEEIEKTITLDRYAREKTLNQLGNDIGLLANTILRILKRLGYRKCKPSMKPGLTQEMKDARYKFCKEHENWTLKD